MQPLSISELHKENLRGESELGRIRSQVSSLDSQIRADQKDSQQIAERSHLNTYYQSLRNNVITLLENVRIPHHGQQYGATANVHHAAQQYPSHPHAQQYAPPHYYSNYVDPASGFSDRKM